MPNLRKSFIAIIGHPSFIPDEHSSSTHCSNAPLPHCLTTPLPRCPTALFTRSFAPCHCAGILGLAASFM